MAKRVALKIAAPYAWLNWNLKASVGKVATVNRESKEVYSSAVWVTNGKGSFGYRSFGLL